MPRTDQANQQYLHENGCLGDDPTEFIKSFNELKPMYASYEEFIDAMLSEV